MIRNRPKFVALFIVAAATACGDSRGPFDPRDSAGPETPASPLTPLPSSAATVSEPVSGSSLNSVSGPMSAEDGLTYLSMPPETEPTAARVRVRNTSTGERISVEIADGGFDPVPIPTSVGDTLHITLVPLDPDDDEKETENVVPEREPPIVVRTTTTGGRTRVPLNSVIIVVFSEPVDQGTLGGAVRLLDGDEELPITLLRSENGFRVEVTPSVPLQFNTEYTITVETGVRDLSGDSLAVGSATTFTTAIGNLQGVILYSTTEAVWVLNPDGSEGIWTNRALVSTRIPGVTVSPDGGHLAIVRTYPINSASGEELLVVDLATNDTMTVAQQIWSGFDQAEFGGVLFRGAHLPSWSPDGTRILVTRRDFGVQGDEIFSYPAGGGNGVPLTREAGYDGHAVWSPSGSEIAFMSRRDGIGDIYIMDADGSNVRRLTDHPNYDGWPTWSPDGTQIAFESARLHPNPAALQPWPEALEGQSGFSVLAHTWIVPVDGSSEPVPLTDGTYYSREPAWSPDGERIAFVGMTDDQTNFVRTIRVDGTDVVDVVFGIPNRLYHPSWSPP